jgi:hypothetical protein
LNCDKLVRLGESWATSTYKVGVKAESRRIAVGKDERINLKLSDDARQVVVVFHKDMGYLDGVSVGTGTISDVADRISNMRLGRVEVEVLAVPTVRELNGSVEVGVLRTRCNSSWEAALSTLVPRRSLVANPLRDVVLVGRRVLLGCTYVTVSSRHAEALGKLKGLAHSASSCVDVVNLMTIGLEYRSAMRTWMAFPMALLTGTLM